MVQIQMEYIQRNKINKSGEIVIVCHKCGKKTKQSEEKTVCIRILTGNDGLYEYTQSFNLCVKCKDKLLDAVSEVISNCDSYRAEAGAAVKMILKKSKENENKTTKKKK